MNKNNNQAWKTKYGPRRVRVEAPTWGEAIFAAQGLTDDPRRTDRNRRSSDGPAAGQGSRGNAQAALAIAR